MSILFSIVSRIIAGNIRRSEISIGDGEVKEWHLNKLEKINALINEVLRMRNPAFGPITRIVKND